MVSDADSTRPPGVVVDDIRIAKPCPALWERMAGDERVRFCEQCRLHVYNLSAMTLDEASALLEEREGRLCVRFYRRRDGTVLTRDCPVGLRAFRRRLAAAQAAGYGGLCAVAAALLGMLPGLGFGRPSGSTGVPIRPGVAITAAPDPPPAALGRTVMGAIRAEPARNGRNEDSSATRTPVVTLPPRPSVAEEVVGAHVE